MAQHDLIIDLVNPLLTVISSSLSIDSRKVKALSAESLLKQSVAEIYSVFTVP